MAATLALLRSRLLLPGDDAVARDARAEAEALRRQMVDRAAAAAGAAWLERRPQLGRDVFGRGQHEAERSRAGRVGDITGLLRACLVALELPWDAEPAFRLPAPPPWTVAQATARIRQMLPGATTPRELGAFLPRVPADSPDREWRCRSAVAATFCAGLELAREPAISLKQPEQWGAVVVYAVPRGPLLE